MSESRKAVSGSDLGSGTQAAGCSLSGVSRDFGWLCVGPLDAVLVEREDVPDMVGDPGTGAWVWPGCVLHAAAAMHTWPNGLGRGGGAVTIAPGSLAGGDLTVLWVVTRMHVRQPQRWPLLAAEGLAMHMDLHRSGVGVSIWNGEELA